MPFALWFVFRSGAIVGCDADDLDGERCEVGEDTVQVCRIPNRSGQAGVPRFGMVDDEVVGEVTEYSFRGSASDDDLVRVLLVHVHSVNDCWVSSHHSACDLTRVRSKAVTQPRGRHTVVT